MGKFMTDSQFATFRADVQRAARLEVMAQAAAIREELIDLVQPQAEVIIREEVRRVTNNVSGQVAATAIPQPKDGDRLVNDQTGEVFWWFRGEYRRWSELEAYRGALRACGL